jgi:hypothetical protein
MNLISSSASSLFLAGARIWIGEPQPPQQPGYHFNSKIFRALAVNVSAHAKMYIIWAVASVVRVEMETDLDIYLTNYDPLVT